MSAPRIPPYIFVCWFCLLLFEICLLVGKEWAGCVPFSFQDERIWVYCKWRACVQGGFQRGQRLWAFTNLSVKIRLVLAFSTFSLVRPDSIRPLILHVWCGRWNLQDAMSLWYHGPMQKGATLRRIWKLYFSLYLRCFCETAHVQGIGLNTWLLSVLHLAAEKLYKYLALGGFLFGCLHPSSLIS